MPSHSRTKAKARKSAGSAAKSAKKPAAKPAASNRVEEQFKITPDDIIRAVSGAVDTLPGEETLPENFVTKFLNNEHPGMDIDASREEQCMVHLAASIVTALRPFLG